MSVKKDIIAALIVDLGVIKIEDGYNSNIRKVSDYPLAFDADSKDVPFIYIEQNNERVLVEDNTNIRYACDVSLVLFARDSSDGHEALNYLIDDVKKIILAGLTLGTYCLDAYMTGMDKIYLSDGQRGAAARINLELTYYTAKATP